MSVFVSVFLSVWRILCHTKTNTHIYLYYTCIQTGSSIAVYSSMGAGCGCVEGGGGAVGGKTPIDCSLHVPTAMEEGGIGFLEGGGGGDGKGGWGVEGRGREDGGGWKVGLKVMCGWAVVCV